MGERKIAAAAPSRAWWARPRKLLVLERPGGGGRSHRPGRREAELAWLCQNGVRLVVSTMGSRHNLAEYERAGLDWHHLPVHDLEEDGAAALEELLGLLRRELRRAGAVAVHENRRTDFVAALGAAHLHEAMGTDPQEGLLLALGAGLTVTPQSAALLGVDYGAVKPRSAIAASTSSGRSVTT